MKEEIKKLFSIPRKGPLNGYLVLEMGNLISGPMASEELARKGALVIKLEKAILLVGFCLKPFFPPVTQRKQALP